MVFTKNDPNTHFQMVAGCGLYVEVPAATLSFLQLDSACSRKEEPTYERGVPLMIPGMAALVWDVEYGLPDCQDTLPEPALETSHVVEPWPLRTPTSWLCLPPHNTVWHSLHRPLAPSFPSRPHHLILIKHAELMLHKAPPEGINIIPLISPSPRSLCVPLAAACLCFKRSNTLCLETLLQLNMHKKGGREGGNEDNEGCETSDAAAACCYRNPSSPPPLPQHPFLASNSVGGKCFVVLGCWKLLNHRVLAVGC